MIARRSLLAAAALATLAATSVAAAAEPWRADEHYRELETAGPKTTNSGKVEVTEVFWYGCGHCYSLDPKLEAWDASKPSFIEFVRVPVGWKGPARQHAKLYYVVQALRRPDLHARIFHAIHADGVQLIDRDETRARELQTLFFNSQGITREQFDAAFDSVTVAENLRRAEELTQAYGVTAVPLLIVNGKYVTGVSEAGGQDELLKLLTYLAGREKH